MSILALLFSFCAQVPREPRPDPKAPGYLGVQFEEVESGIRISSLYVDSPATRAGLEVNDIITHFKGESLSNIPTVQDLVFHTPPHTVVPIDVIRGDKKFQLKLRIGYRPQDFPFSPPRGNDDGNDRPEP